MSLRYDGRPWVGVHVAPKFHWGSPLENLFCRATFLFEGQLANAKPEELLIPIQQYAKPTAACCSTHTWYWIGGVLRPAQKLCVFLRVMCTTKCQIFLAPKFSTHTCWRTTDCCTIIHRVRRVSLRINRNGCTAHHYSSAHQQHIIDSACCLWYRCESTREEKAEIFSR